MGRENIGGPLDASFETIPTVEEEEKSEIPDHKHLKDKNIANRIKRGLKIGILAAGLSAPSTEALHAQSQEKQPVKPQANKEEVVKLTEKQEMQLKEWQSIVIDKMDEIAAANPNIDNGKLEKFMQDGWDLANYVISHGGDVESFKTLLNKVQEENLGIPAAKEVNPNDLKDKESINKLLSKAEALPDNFKVTEEWMWSNDGKIFKQGNEILVVKIGTSSDMQVAYDKAAMETESLLASAMEQQGNIPQLKILGTENKVRLIGNNFEQAVVTHFQIPK